MSKELNNKRIELVELRKEARVKALIITERNKEIEELEEKKIKIQNEIDEQKNANENERQKTKEVRLRVKQEQEKLAQEKSDWEKDQRERKEAKKTLSHEISKLNSWIDTAKEELNAVQAKITASDAVLEERDKLCADIPELEQIVILLKEEVTNSRNTLNDIQKQCANTLSLRDKALEQSEEKLNKIKYEREQEEYKLQALKKEIDKQKNDISIYIARAQIIYNKAFPELEMKL